LSGHIGAFVGVVILLLVCLALAYLGYSRYRDNRSNSLWLFTAVAGLLGTVLFVALLAIALV